ncbi:MAG TPA: RDD family protein [Acidiferrobacter sp.]|nr:RDD family protein [Acidiferrobacter sp.]
MNTQKIASSKTPGRNGAFFRRMGANAYDAILLFTLWILASAPFAIYFVVVLHDPASALLQNILHVYLPIVGFAYFGYAWIKKGQTFGMQAWRLKIFAADGHLGIGRAFLRYVLALIWFGALIEGFMLLFHDHYLLAIGPFALFAVAYLWIFFDPDAQALHDRLVGTRVLFLPKLAHARQEPGAEANQA